LLTMLLPQLEEGLNQVFATLPFVRRFIQALLGEDLGRQINPQSLQAIIWVHPTVLALIWAQEIIFCTRVPPGEIDRGTIDILLSWPISRRKLFVAETLMWLVGGMMFCAMMLSGHFMARWFAPSESPASMSRVLTVLANLYSMYVAVGAMALLVSSWSNHRGRAMAVSFALVLGSFLLNFLVQFWPTVASLAPLSILHYYHPAEILANGAVPWFNIVVLWTIAFAGWVLALETFSRRSISTV
jgi:ABC-type transport system involved in multi-copper enzyme maturation permease subunit